MHIADLLTPERISLKAHIPSKKRLLVRLASLIAATDESLNERGVFERLCAREKMGSTALRHGFAIPHARIEGLRFPVAVFLSLAEPLDFDAEDGDPVDLFFAVAVPFDAAEDHLKLLARLAEIASDPALCQHLREATDPHAVYQLLAETPSKRASA